jgi:hypothetical protein
MKQAMSIAAEYPELMYPEIVIPIISMTTCIIMGILGVFYTQGVLVYPPETVIIVTLLCCILAKIAWSWGDIWAGIGAVVAPAFATMGSVEIKRE